MPLTYRQILLAWTSPVACLIGLPTVASAAERPVTIEIQAGPLDAALLSLGTQARLKIMFTSDLVAGRRAPALRGRMTAREALARLLGDADIEVRQAAPGILVLHPRRAVAMPASAPVESPRLVAGQLAAIASSDPIAATLSSVSAEKSGAETVMVSEIVVGSHIRGARKGASPVVLVGRGDIDRAGYATVADALTALPQSFGGAISDDTMTTGADSTGTNQARGTAVNLRGLGADATLVLINGRRMAGSGLLGDFSDVSSIPLAAVARVEVLLDGASALYGSDAVGGVVNVVMRDRYDGAETRARIGGSTRGDLGQYQLAQTLGRTWSTGSVMASLEYQRRDRLRAVDRDFTANADLRSLGGSDRRYYFSSPGTVLGINPLTGGLAPMWAIPAGQDGTRLTPGDFIAGKTNLSNWRAAMDNLPSQERASVYGAVSQDIGSRVTLSADLRYSNRRWTAYAIAPIALMTVTANNPYFVSPNGSAVDYIAYSLEKERPGLKNTGEVQSRSMSLGADVKLPGDWSLNTYVVHGEEIATSLASGNFNSVFLAEALGNTADNPATAYSAARDGYFNPFTGTGSNSKAVLDFVTSGYDARRTVGLLDTFNAAADGALFKLPAGEVRMALGAQVRREALKTIGTSTSFSATPVEGFSRRAERTVSALFAEVRAPLLGDGFRRPGVERLELSAAVRHERYDGGLSSTVPKFGLIWSPVADVNLKATFGKSFRAPSLSQRSDPQFATPVNISNGSTSVLTLLRYGGNPNLKPERATSWTASAEYAPVAQPELRLSVTLFDTRFTNRIGQPANDNIATVLTASDLAPFRTFVSPATSTADLALVQSVLQYASATTVALYPATAYQAIADGRYVNAGEFHVRGLDVSGVYGTRVLGEKVTFSGNLSWMMSYARKITASAQSVELTGMATYPADLRARASAAWEHGPFTTTFSLNHTGDLHDQNGVRIDSLTTADLQVQWTSTAEAGAWRGLTAALTAQNLLDTDPPFYDSRTGVGYDPANYEPTGRVVALQLTKAW